MNKEDNHIIIEVLNSNGDIKLTKMGNPRAIFQNNEYPDEYIFKDVDYVNIFSLIQENNKLKKEKEDLQERIDKAIEFVQKTQFDCGDFNCCGFGVWKNGKNELLEILKGEDK